MIVEVSKKECWLQLCPLSNFPGLLSAGSRGNPRPPTETEKVQTAAQRRSSRTGLNAWMGGSRDLVGLSMVYNSFR